MTIYELTKLTESDYDVWDEVFDDCVTCCYIDEPEDDYDEFCIALYKKVECTKSDSYSAYADWYGFIERNLSIFKEFADKYWIKGNQEDEEDFICEWIGELHKWLAGYLPEESYADYRKELLDRCE